MDDPVLDLLYRVRKCPAMYVGRHSAEALFMFLGGYVMALVDHTSHDCSRYAAFIEGLSVKYGTGGGGRSWAWVLSRAAGGDAAGLDLFFEELDLFRQTNPGQS